MEVHWRVAEVNDPHTEVHSVLQARDTCVKLHLEKRNGANHQLTITPHKKNWGEITDIQAEYPKTPRKVCWLFLWESDSRDKVIRQEEVEEMMSQPGHSP